MYLKPDVLRKDSRRDVTVSRVVTLPLRDEEAARDLVQQVMLLAIEKLRGGSIRDADQIASFILGVSRTIAKDLKRLDRRREKLRDAFMVQDRVEAPVGDAMLDIDHLRRPFTSLWTTRYGEDFKTPQGAIHGPKVMIINENAGSGGDLLPWMFRQQKLGTLVGKRTWGGLVGVLGFPVLMDGGGVTAPNLAFWTPEDGYAVENEGVPPDVDIDLWPEDVAAGKDPQLEKAIEIVLKELEKNPPKNPKHPAFPVRVKK